MDTHMTVVAANTSRCPTGMISSEIRAPFVRSTLPNCPLFAVPFAGTVKPVTFRQMKQPRLVQRNKSFDPHLLVVPVGSVVAFPNHDPFFHYVFSLFEGKRFDLGLYEAGSTRDVHFDKPGISYIFCNIHPEMSAVVITLTTPFYAIAHGEGPVEIPNVPYGRYRLNLWSEGNSPEIPQPSGREVTVAEGSPKAVIVRVPAINRQNLAHKNKYGRDYDAPTPDSPVYRQQP